MGFSESAPTQPGSRDDFRREEVFVMEADECTCAGGGEVAGEGADLLSSLAIAFIVVVGLLLIDGILLIGLARRFWKRKVEESRGSESFLETRDFELAREERRRDLPPPYSPVKPPSPMMLPPAYEEPNLGQPTTSSNQPSYQELIEALHQQLLLQGPGAVHLLHLLQTDQNILARHLAGESLDEE